MSKKEQFNEPPNTVNSDRAVLNKGSGTYSPLAEVAGKQPYYWYQGVGKVTGEPLGEGLLTEGQDDIMTENNQYLTTE